MNDKQASAPVDLLRALSELAGPAGQEGAVADRIAAALTPYCDSVRRDSFDNVIGLARGETSADAVDSTDRSADPAASRADAVDSTHRSADSAADRPDASTAPTDPVSADRERSGPSASRPPRLMIAAHSDEIGLIVTKIDKGGFLRVTSIGGIDPRALVAQQVTVLTDPPLPGFVGVKPPHILSEAERKQVVPLKDMFVDVGLPEETVRQRVRPGDMIVVDRQFTELLGGRVAGKALDNRAGVAAMIEAVALLQQLRHVADVYPVATVQEEVGYRGAIVSAYDIVPDMAIAVDVGFGASPGIPPQRAIEMGKGPAIARGANVHPRLFELLVDVAKTNGIPHQIEPMPAASGTDGWALQVVRSGIPTAVISIPLRSMHTSVEVVAVEDVRNTARLLAHTAAALTEADAEGWTYELA